jgi:hypothetical protein
MLSNLCLPAAALILGLTLLIGLMADALVSWWRGMRYQGYHRMGSYKGRHRPTEVSWRAKDWKCYTDLLALSYA